MDEENIFVPVEWLKSEERVASCPKGSSSGGQRISPPPSSPTQSNPEYYNLCGPPPSPPRRRDHAASCPKTTTSSALRGEKISQNSPVSPASLPPGDRQPSPEYYNIGEAPPSPPPRRPASGGSHKQREPVPPPPRRTSAPGNTQACSNGLPHTNVSNSTDKPPLPPSRSGLGKKCCSIDEVPIPLPRHRGRRSASVDYLGTSGAPLPPQLPNRKLSTPVNAGQPSNLAPHSPPPHTRSSASSDSRNKRELPPAPTTSHTPTSIRSHFIPTSCAMTFEEVADPQKVTLPQLFMASATYMYTCGISSVAEGSILLVKYTKSTSMVHGREQDGTRIQMSLNTPATLSPITDECNQRHQMSAEELLACKPHPVAVRVMQSFKQREFTVERGTLLFLQTAGTVLAKGKTKKLVFQDYRGNKVMLTATCSGIFSSHPDDVKLFLAELVAKCPLPLNVLFEDGIYSANIVTLDRVYQQDVLVVQLCNKRDGQPIGQDHELANHSGLSLVRVALNDKKSETVTHTTGFELGPANASQVPAHKDEAGCTMPGMEKNSTQKSYLETNPYMKMLKGSNHGIAHSSSEQQPLWNDESSHSGGLNTFATRQTGAERPIDDDQPRKDDSEKPTYSSDDGSDDDEKYLYVTGAVLQVKYTAEQRNIAYLKTLNEADVLKLLDAMNMEVYKPTFQREAVDGHLLSELTNEMLQNELGVQSPLHCLKLSTIIKGNRSAKELLASRLASN